MTDKSCNTCKKLFTCTWEQATLCNILKDYALWEEME